MQTYDTYKKMAWGAIGLSGIIAVTSFVLMSGVAAPYVGPVLQSWDLPALILIFALGFGGFALLGFVESWQWEAAGREVGLTPAEDGLPRGLSQNDDSLVGKAVLSGRIRGRPVRARTYTKNLENEEDEEHVEDEDRRSNITFTVVETDLNRAVDGGVIANPAGGGLTDSADGGADAYDEPLAAISDDESHARAIISGDAREALLEMEELGQLFVGDAETVFQEALPEVGDSVPDIAGFSVGSMVQSGIATLVAQTGIEGDEQTVSHRVEGTVLDADELERQVEAVVTVADVYEEVQGEHSSS